ncbi:ankyrin [Macroventuria anomochaeta]|uniref:Ankyrin n=1 Tax=Macroventuria anomochaeta TaxID=301207 RepID=A0ACB6S667_9PLEO|nr:ankyrin [Macroventuria anomochaeta]KAF2629473.1 ankyrin [Macroventuria anomochaeta]
MTKDWDAVQDEIKELSFNQKKRLEEVKDLMERKYKFRASTRAYRMKLKEWGLMRQKGRKARLERNRAGSSGCERDNEEPRAPSATAEPMSIDSESLEHRTKTGGWQVVSSVGLTVAEPTFMGLLSQTANLQPSIDIPVWMQDPPIASNALQNMLGCVLDNECEKLEKLLMAHMNEVNDPIGMPFELPSSRFSSHPALSQMFVMQHPRQTLLDIACGMPNGPVVWVLLSYGAKGSTHPLGIDLALHNAIKNGRHYTVQALLIPGRSNVNGLPDNRWKPLLQAVFWTGPEVVNILLKRGARVDDVGPSPTSPGIGTALQLCLELRACNYGDEAVRSKCNENLKLLLNAGASVHVPPPEGSSASPFEKFIEPWQNYDHWNMRLSWEEMDCLGTFVEKGADLSAKFFASPCAAGSSNTFIHQALWHSPPCISRQVVHEYSNNAPISGGLMLHEVVGSCADAKRHCAEALGDIEILLNRGVDPNVLDSFGMTPLRKCIEQASATDVAALTQKLLDGGADPEYEDVDGIQPYAVAALTLAEPVRTEVLHAMLAKMLGLHNKTQEGRTYRWQAGLFPIPENPTYQQVLACTKPDDDFQLSMHEMVPLDVQPIFQRAYLAIISSWLLERITKEAASKKISENDRWDISSVLSLRKAANLPNYQFDQGLIIVLLDFPNISTIKPSSAPTTTPQSTTEPLSRNSTPQTTILPDSAVSDTAPAYPPFQLNTNSPSTLSHTSPISRPNVSNDAFVGDTTQIRWLDPESKRAPALAAAYVLQYKCAVCAHDRLLTKSELQKHEIEHAHTAECDGVGCTRRFCKETLNRKKEEIGCQDHLFADNI